MDKVGDSIIKNRGSAELGKDYSLDQKESMFVIVIPEKNSLRTEFEFEYHVYV